MPKVSAFHTTSEEYSADHRSVYHDNNECGYGAEIKPEHRVPGTGGHPLVATDAATSPKPNSRPRVVRRGRLCAIGQKRDSALTRPPRRPAVEGRTRGLWGVNVAVSYFIGRDTRRLRSAGQARGPVQRVCAAAGTGSLHAIVSIVPFDPFVYVLTGNDFL